MTLPTVMCAIWLSALLLLTSTSAWPPPDGVLSPAVNGVDGVPSEVAPTPGPVLSQCVQSCECYPDRRQNVANLVVECSDSDGLPPVFPNDTTRLRISDSRVHSLRAQLHKPSLSWLRDLEVTHSGIREVAEDAFRDLPKLRNVNLSGNAIAALSAKHFAHQRHPELIDVSGNAALDCAAFRREMASVRPRACVKCDADNEPCGRTTRGTKGTTSRSTGNSGSESTSAPSPASTEPRLSTDQKSDSTAYEPDADDIDYAVVIVVSYNVNVVVIVVAVGTCLVLAAVLVVQAVCGKRVRSIPRPPTPDLIERQLGANWDAPLAGSDLSRNVLLDCSQRTLDQEGRGGAFWQETD